MAQPTLCSSERYPRHKSHKHEERHHTSHTAQRSWGLDAWLILLEILQSRVFSVTLLTLSISLDDSIGIAFEDFFFFRLNGPL